MTTSIDVAAPRDGRAKTRITWLLRQLRDASPTLRIDVSYPLARETTTGLLKAALAKPEALLLTADPASPSADNPTARATPTAVPPTEQAQPTLTPVPATPTAAAQPVEAEAREHCPDQVQTFYDACVATWVGLVEAFPETPLVLCVWPEGRYLIAEP